MGNFNNLFIFEIANNHQGDVKHGIKIINAMGEIARKYKLNAAVKLQYRQLDSFIHPQYRNDNEIKHIRRFLSTELKPNQFLELIKATKANGLTAVCTPFDEGSVDMILKHQIEVIKIASCSAEDWPLLQKVMTTQKPVIASTGGLSIIQIDNLVSFLNNRNTNFALLHCVSIYPSPDEMLNLNFISRLIQRYPNVPIGYSGHEMPENTDPVKIAVALGARILERHVGMPTDTITLNDYSLNPLQAEKWVEAAMLSKKISGSKEKVITDVERDSLFFLKRGVYAKEKIKKGELFTSEKVFFAIPCKDGQLSSGEFGTYRANYYSSRDYDKGDAVFEAPSKDNYHKLREIIHDAKGILSEAGIVVNENASVELSHHYGLEKFREYGCLIVNLVNREYCKKIIVLLPGQKHSEHYHLKKEETFHILNGQLSITINGIQKKLSKGDILTIHKGDRHAFDSITGCIIEEISTTHFRNDSFYSDPLIAEQDPLGRKTFLEKF